jgi:hypothetical protein
MCVYNSEAFEERKEIKRGIEGRREGGREGEAANFEKRINKKETKRVSNASGF